MENIKKTPSQGKKIDVSVIVGMGLLTAVTVVLYLISMNLQVGAFNITLTLIPIVVGAALYGWKAGGWLGLVFGVMVLFTPSTAAFLTLSVPGTVITVLVKGILSGVVPALVYRLIAKKNSVAAVLTVGILAPIVNTGVFLLGCFVFFYDTLLAGASEAGMNVFLFTVVFYVSWNFVIELGINIVLNPAIVSIINLGKKIVKSNKAKG